MLNKNQKWSLAQAIFLLATLFLPFKVNMNLSNVIRYLGILFILIGIGLASYAALSLKSNLKPSPKPRVGGSLITTGLYSIVRHPAYSCILLTVLGFSLWMNDAIRLLLTVGFFVFLNAKSSVEERWLEKAYPEYGNYKKRVTKKFIPWIY